MMEYASDLHRVIADEIENTMALADQTPHAVTVARLRLTTAWIRLEESKRTIDCVLIRICRVGAEMLKAIFDYLGEVGISRPAQYDISHAWRDYFQLFP